MPLACSPGFKFRNFFAPALRAQSKQFERSVMVVRHR